MVRGPIVFKLAVDMEVLLLLTKCVAFIAQSKSIDLDIRA